MNVKTWLQMLLATVTFAASGAYAQVYVGAGGGYALGKLGTSGTSSYISTFVASPTVTQVSDDSAIGWKLFLGFDYNQNLGFEFGYTRLGEYGTTSVTAIPTTILGQVNSSVWFWDVLGKIPVTTGVSIYGRLGVTYYQAKNTLGGIAALTDDGLGWKTGAGAQFDVTKNIALRGEWEYYAGMGSNSNGIGKLDVNLFNAQILWKF